jgi:hypothetical protein
MKRNIFNKVFFVLFAATVALSSCGNKDETPAPTIKINTNSLGSDQTGGTAETGTTVTINLTADASEGIKSITATKSINGAGGGTLPGYPVTSGFTSKNSHTWNATYTLVETSGEVVLRFVVTDNKGKEAFINFTIRVSDLNSFTARLLGAQTNAAGSYFSASSGEVYTAAQANANVGLIDISYAALGNEATATLLSWRFRGDASTGLTAPVPAGARNTYFAASSVTAAQFTALGSSTESAFTGATVNSSNAQSVAIQVGRVYAFLTQDGKKGLVHIESIAPGTAGSVTINVKVQK